MQSCPFHVTAYALKLLGCRLAATVRMLPLPPKYRSPNSSSSSSGSSSNGSRWCRAISNKTTGETANLGGAGKSNQESPAMRTKSSSKRSSKASTWPTRNVEQQLWAQGYQAIAGVDEAGAGPLAGPVVAAAAILPPGVELPLLKDSKQLTGKQRQAMYEQLTTHPEVSYAIALVDASTIDRINILQAALLAMRTAVEGLADAGLKPDYLLIDGNTKPSGLDDTPVQLLSQGDASVTCIAAASVLAKVTRDNMMLELDQQYPQYGFAQHKGYPVPGHRAAIEAHGPCPVHRRSFEPIKSLTGWPGYPHNPGPAAGKVVVAVVGGSNIACVKASAGLEL